MLHNVMAQQVTVLGKPVYVIPNQKLMLYPKKSKQIQNKPAAQAAGQTIPR